MSRHEKLAFLRKAFMEIEKHFSLFSHLHNMNYLFNVNVLENWKAL